MTIYYYTECQQYKDNDFNPCFEKNKDESICDDCIHNIEYNNKNKKRNN